MKEQRGKHIETLLVIATGMTIFFLVTKRIEFLYVAVGVAVVGLIFPFAAKYIHLGWMGIAKVLGFINSHIILGLIFFLFLTPLALIRRLGRKDLLQLRKRSSGSYFTERNHKYSGKDLENPW
jgi:Saxitoxin biosynthesis operon protein SxtJ